ncbi:MAG: patatin-like phospholipase family protein [Gemmatimonadaceae bacterium]|nr:patatin-like phospholipase family protein [Gemmatimonadaceae bacterium]
MTPTPPKSAEPTTDARSGRRVANVLWNIIGGLFVWLLIMAAYQGGWSTTSSAFIGVMLLVSFGGMLVGMGSRFLHRPMEVVAGVMMLAAPAWTYFAGTYRSWPQALWDVLGIAVGALAALLVERGWQAHRARRVPSPVVTEGRLRDELRPIGYLIAAWVGITVVTLLRPSLLPSDPQRFAVIDVSRSIAAGEAQAFTGLRVGMALSGGGYRAAVFHSGTLHALERLGVRVNHLSTVSGGSIIGSYYAIGGDPVAFKDAVAEGRFNLKRELLLAHNAVRLPFPIRVPGIGVRLFPWYEYSRRDVQAGMLDRLLLDGRAHSAAPVPQAPNLIVNATDLTFGLIVGFLPDGILVQGPDGDVGVYRGARYQPDASFSLAERVSISGAFPLAFPSTGLGARVEPFGASGRGKRPLQLVDGGVADNSGRETLLNANAVACDSAPCSDSTHTDTRFVSDVMLVSDGGAIFGVNGEYVGIAQLSRAVDVGGARNGLSVGRSKSTPTVQFSAQEAYLNPGMQFRLYQDPDSVNPSDASKQWFVRFDPRDGYPDAVLTAITDLLPDSTYPKVRTALTAYRSARSSVGVQDERRWGYWLPRMATDGNCDAERASGPNATELQGLAGICEAAELRRAFTAELRVLLEAFRATSTLEDQLGRVRTEQLFRLGQLLVYRDWPRMRDASQQAQCIRTSRAECPKIR